jgi:glutamine synthetase
MLSENHDSYTARLTHEFNTVKWDNIEFLQIRYTDVPGRFLASYILKDNDDCMENLFTDGIGLDGSSVSGFVDISESDLILLPDISTIRAIPPTTTMPSHSIAAVISDVYRGFGQGRLSKDPRNVSQRMERYLGENGLSCQIGSEVECFIFDDILFDNNNDNFGGGYEESNETHSHEPKIISAEQYGTGKYPIRKKGGYNAPPFQDSLREFRFEVAQILRKYYSIKVTNLNHEVASSGQIEINFMHDTLTKTADNVQMYKDVVRNVAKQYNKVANFMPKPIYNDKNNRTRCINGAADHDVSDNGSGMHTSVSLWSYSSNGVMKKNNNNIFYDENDSYAELSQVARYFIGGVLNHASSLAALVTPTVNSYHRIIPGFEAPVYIAWARGNRSAVIRVPVDQKNNFKSKRIEFRAPDPSANPYLAFPAIVAAGLDGIKKKSDPGDPVNENIYKMSDSKRKGLGIKSLPRSLGESLEVLKSDSDYLDVCFDNELIETYNMLKQQEIVQTENGKSKAMQFMLYYDA